MTQAIRTVPKSYPVTVKPNQLEDAEARLHSMPLKRGENEIYRVRELVARLFLGLTSMRNNGYSWEEITQWFIQEFPDAPISPRTLQEYWRSVKAQKDKAKKSSRRSSPNQSPRIASTKTPKKETSIESVSVELTPVLPIVLPVENQIISEELEAALAIPDYRDQLAVEHFLTALEKLKTIDPNRWRQLMCEARNADVNITGTIARLPSQINALFNQY